MRKHLFLVVILCGVLLLCGCGEKAETESGTRTAQPTFPLSSEVVEAALPGWEISQTLVHDVDGVVTYMLRPEGAETNLNGIVVNSYDLPDTGRTLLTGSWNRIRAGRTGRRSRQRLRNGRTINTSLRWRRSCTAGSRRTMCCSPPSVVRRCRGTS